MSILLFSFIFILVGVLFDKIGSKLSSKKEMSVVEEKYLFKWQFIVDLWMRKGYCKRLLLYFQLFYCIAFISLLTV